MRSSLNGSNGVLGTDSYELHAPNGPPPSGAEMVDVLFRHKWKAAVFFVVMVGLTIAAAVYFPRKYESEAKLLVRVGRETAMLDPTATTGQVVTVQQSHERDVKSALEILRSQSIVEQVVDAIGVEEILSADNPPSADSLFKWPSLNDLDPITDREQAILQVSRQIQISTVEGADILTISAKSKSPESSQELVQQVLDEFLSVQGRLSRNEGGHAFFEEQTELLEGQLDEALAALRNAKNQHGILTVDGKRTILNNQLGNISDQIGRSDAELAYSKAKVSGLKDSLRTLPVSVVTQAVTGIGNDATDQMRAQLYELEVQENKLAAQYEEQHPLLVALREQRKQVQDIYDRQPGQRAQSTNSLNTTRQQLDLEHLMEEASIAAMSSKRESLLTQQRQLIAELETLNEHESKIVELENEVERLRATRDKYADRLEETRIDQVLAAHDISRINVIQQPTFSNRPAAPRALHLMAIGLFLATTGAVFVVIVANYFDRSFTTPEQVERQLDLPVLVSIPRSSRGRAVELN